MNIGRTIFAQLMDFFPEHEFNLAVRRHHGNRRTRSFSCRDQFMCMAFAQLAYRESLRDIETCLGSLGSKLYHCGIHSQVSRSTLADANEKRPWQIYQDTAFALIDRARVLYKEDRFITELDQAIYALDSTIISLCLTLFPWAKAANHQKTSAGVKLHTLFAVQSRLPVFSMVSNANVNDVHMLDEIVYEPGSIYVLDRGYTDLVRLKRIDNAGAFFVIRAKTGLRFTRIYSAPVCKEVGVRADQTITLDIALSRLRYPDNLRRIKYYSDEKDKSFVYLTNNFLLDAKTIADLYRSRWQIELFFKWIKQHLRIKAFYGTSPNAVRTQIWIALSVFVLVAIVKKELKLDLSLYTILQILSVSLFEKESINQRLTESNCLIDSCMSTEQLFLFTS
jgi:hypothetical protein